MVNAFQSPQGNSKDLSVFARLVLLSLSPCLACLGCNRSAAGDRAVVHSQPCVEGHHYEVVEVDLQRATMQLFWQKPDHTRFENFDALKSFLGLSHQQLLFAANAGIFEPTFTPTGLHVENGSELSPLNLKQGNGNFYLQPNGVFFVDDGGAGIVESTRYSCPLRDVRLATQSGPLLLIAGKTNPNFDASSKNRRLRSGIGLSGTHRVVFILSRDRVTFFEFAEMFRACGCSDALYLDGEISKFYLPDEASAASDEHFAGILAVVGKR
jgi:uncharacterized protein YigE (DUF2233 family)